MWSCSLQIFVLKGKWRPSSFIQILWISSRTVHKIVQHELPYYSLTHSDMSSLSLLKHEAKLHCSVSIWMWTVLCLPCYSSLASEGTPRLKLEIVKRLLELLKVSRLIDIIVVCSVGGLKSAMMEVILNSNDITEIWNFVHSQSRGRKVCVWNDLIFNRNCPRHDKNAEQFSAQPHICF